MGATSVAIDIAVYVPVSVAVGVSVAITVAFVAPWMSDRIARTCAVACRDCSARLLTSAATTAFWALGGLEGEDPDADDQGEVQPEERAGVGGLGENADHQRRPADNHACQRGGGGQQPDGAAGSEQAQRRPPADSSETAGVAVVDDGGFIRHKGRTILANAFVYGDILVGDAVRFNEHGGL